MPIPRQNKLIPLIRTSLNYIERHMSSFASRFSTIHYSSPPPHAWFFISHQPLCTIPGLCYHSSRSCLLRRITMRTMRAILPAAALLLILTGCTLFGTGPETPTPSDAIITPLPVNTGGTEATGEVPSTVEVLPTG